MLRRDDTFADLRFDNGAFAQAVARIGRILGASRRVRLFRNAITELADREVVDCFREHLVRGMTASSHTQDREAIAAALVCLDPVLAAAPLPARDCPTLQIIFNNQLEEWNRRNPATSSDATEPSRT